MVSDNFNSVPHNYRNLAKFAVEKKDFIEASSLYFKAAETALPYYKKNFDEKNQKYWQDFIDNCIDLGQHYKPKLLTTPIKKSHSKKPSLENIISSEVPDFTFQDVAGMKNIKKEIERKIIWPVTDPKGYEAFVGKGNRGLIMYGPPGCGKTLIAKAAAGEANKRGHPLSFYKVGQSDIKDKYVGRSEQKMKELFKKAAKNQPSMIFFDEIDSLAGKRDSDNTSHNKNLANEFKADFDEIQDKTILVIGATNHPWNIDSAFIRPGRFEQFMFVPPPNLEARTKIFELKTKGKNIDKNIEYQKLSKLTRGYTGADIEKICKDAGSFAYERYREDPNTTTTYSDFLKSIQNTVPSLKQWNSEVKDQMLDGRYSKPVLRKGISNEFNIILSLVKQLDEIFK
mgnify:CR=1 FL=1